MRVLGLLILLNLVACSTPAVTRLQNLQPGSLPSGSLLQQIPFFPQEAYQCGPAALATVLSASNRPVIPEELVSQVYVPARQGSLQIEMLAAARRYERIPYLIGQNLETLLREIDGGRPVLVMQNLGLSWLPQWHYAVAIGYDLEEETLILHSGLRRHYRVDINTFERTWSRSGHWGFVVLRPGELPVAAEPGPYLEAVAAFETVAAENQAEAAYQAGISRWPQNASLQLALGNSYYARGHLQAAVDQFNRVTRGQPASADAHNNLAFVLMELGDLEKALVHADRAVAIGGSRMATYQQTATRIRQRLRQ